MNVNKHTRAGKNGKTIICPKCGKEHKVYHFSWCGLGCDCIQNEKESEKRCIDKYDWILK